MTKEVQCTKRANKVPFRCTTLPALGNNIYFTLQVEISEYKPINLLCLSIIFYCQSMLTCQVCKLAEIMLH